MVENDSSSFFTGIENDSVQTGSVYFSSKITEDDALSVASLSLPVGIIRPSCFELYIQLN